MEKRKSENFTNMYNYILPLILYNKPKKINIIFMMSHLPFLMKKMLF